MATIIQSNGSRWAGEELATLDELADVLTEHTLDPRFEAYGDFLYKIAANEMEDRNRELSERGLDPSCTFQLFGNFFDVSHVFNIYTDDPDVVARFRALITANKKTPAYRQAKKERAEHARYWKRREREQRKNSRTVRSSR